MILKSCAKGIKNEVRESNESLFESCESSLESKSESLESTLESHKSQRESKRDSHKSKGITNGRAVFCGGK